MRGNHEVVKSPVRVNDPYVLTPEQIARQVTPVYVTQLAPSNGHSPGRSVPDCATVAVGAFRDILPSVRFNPGSHEEREQVVAAVSGFLRVWCTSNQVNQFHNVDWDDLVDFLVRLGGEVSE